MTQPSPITEEDGQPPQGLFRSLFLLSFHDMFSNNVYLKKIGLASKGFGEMQAKDPRSFILWVS